VHAWVEVDGDVRINYEVEPGGGAVRFKVGTDVELYAEPEALDRIGALATEAALRAREAVAGKCGH